jgi:hypothetical protein
MSRLKRIVLDVLKPHQPNALEFAQALGERNPDCRITLAVDEIDEKTESVMIEIEAADISYAAIEESINALGASVHSIDEVEVDGRQA